jgi:hypothetical protein
VALDIAREIGDSHIIAMLLHNLGSVAIYEGDYEQARQYLR